jgi:DHA2 family multidrug resistance protein
MTSFSPHTDYWGIAWPGFFRGMGSGLIFMPLTTLSLGAVPREHMGTASGLFNMVRTIGGGVGIAILITLLSRGAQVHQSYLVAHVHAYNPVMWRYVTVLGGEALPWMSGEGGFAPASLAAIYGEVQRQALLMAFIDDFRLIAYLFFFLSPIVFFMRRPQQQVGGGGGH